MLNLKGPFNRIGTWRIRLSALTTHPPQAQVLLYFFSRPVYGVVNFCLRRQVEVYPYHHSPGLITSGSSTKRWKQHGLNKKRTIYPESIFSLITSGYPDAFLEATTLYFVIPDWYHYPGEHNISEHFVSFLIGTIKL
jgi:hypothetical protein